MIHAYEFFGTWLHKHVCLSPRRVSPPLRYNGFPRAPVKSVDIAKKKCKSLKFEKMDKVRSDEKKKKKIDEIREGTNYFISGSLDHCGLIFSFFHPVIWTSALNLTDFLDFQSHFEV